MIITIDGPAGTGKSTVAKLLAKALGFVYFDTGAMYRALTALMLEADISLEEESKIAALLESFDFRISPDGPRYWVSGRDFTEIIRTPEVTRLVSAVAAQPAVRQSLVSIQRRFARGNDAVFEGRDLGSVVFPQADMKIYLTANAEERAGRRHRELVLKLGQTGPSAQEVLADINRRDQEDSSRAHSPLVRPEGSIEVDTSEMSIEQVVSHLLSLWQQRKTPHSS
jgi:cytidylate kinase